MVTDRHTDTQTDTPSTVTLAAHARRGLIMYKHENYKCISTCRTRTPSNNESDVTWNHVIIHLTLALHMRMRARIQLFPVRSQAQAGPMWRPYLHCNYATYGVLSMSKLGRSYSKLMGILSYCIRSVRYFMRSVSYFMRSIRY